MDMGNSIFDFMLTSMSRFGTRAEQIIVPKPAHDAAGSDAAFSLFLLSCQRLANKFLGDDGRPSREYLVLAVDEKETFQIPVIKKFHFEVAGRDKLGLGIEVQLMEKITSPSIVQFAIVVD